MTDQDAFAPRTAPDGARRIGAPTRSHRPGGSTGTGRGRTPDTDIPGLAAMMPDAMMRDEMARRAMKRGPAAPIQER